MSDGTFYLGVITSGGKVHGFLFKTGDLKANAMVKAILMAQEKQLRVGAYEDPKTKMLGGICVFNPDSRRLHFATVCQVATFNAKPRSLQWVFGFLRVARFATG
jgi:hypothetical protein